MMRFEGISYSKVLLSEVQVIKRIQPLEEDIPVRKSSVSDVADACDRFPPRSVQCYKRGSDGIDVQWECKADIPKKYRFGQISVLCDGFDHPGDPYVLHGSCGLEYNLEYNDDYKSSDFSDSVLFCIVLMLFAFYVLCVFMCGPVNSVELSNLRPNVAQKLSCYAQALFIMR
ncbi:hypothetical protein QR680_000553 [Steinernema hermaphroditum]|uniref:Store-operated calcium entry-associated regulatory factor n=1 Tax=Steinernema hermaphroditum TaxID=289476 RepID=A0AA39LDS5_9BILA|nr:hypothetical protein QR680_000553 [Steinernema hermaphroditum]